MGITSFEEKVADRLAALEARFEALIVQDRPGSKAFGAGRIPFGGPSGVLTDDADLFWDNTNKRLAIGNTAPNVKLDIRGTNNSIGAGPHIEFTTSIDAHRQLQILPYTHDNIHIVFDSYFDGTNWKSSDAGSNFRLSKLNDIFAINYANGVTAGNNVTFAEAIGVENDGFVRYGGVPVRQTSRYFASIANNGIVDLNLTSFCFLFIYAGGASAIMILNGATHTTIEMSDPSAAYTITAGTAASVNVYWSGANSRYELENKRGATIGVRIMVFDMV